MTLIDCRVELQGAIDALERFKQNWVMPRAEAANAMANTLTQVPTAAYRIDLPDGSIADVTEPVFRHITFLRQEIRVLKSALRQ